MRYMNLVTLENFRCFGEKQTARLAPLTLLVGENGTGKTSFMAMLQMLSGVVWGGEPPIFDGDPYDLGSFDEIAHYHRGKSERATAIEAGFELGTSGHKGRPNNGDELPLFEITLENQDTIPVPQKKRVSRGNVWIELSSTGIRFGTPRGVWGLNPDDREFMIWVGLDPNFSRYVSHLLTETGRWTPQSGTKGQPATKDIIQIEQMLLLPLMKEGRHLQRPYASTPVRSKPCRSYDPAEPEEDPEGQYIPMYLSNLYSQDKGKWRNLKKALESFGHDAGLFDEISVKLPGKKGGGPFQIQVQKSGKKNSKGTQRNLVDAGYGVSQILPVITELLRADAPSLFLLQQPEAHLHPSAQAALGSLFCQLAGPRRQLIVETHSDNLLGRVRMDVRDGEGNLKPEDVSVLFFEWQDLDVHIHSLRIDGEGNVLNAPDGYRQFFIDEMERSVWKRGKSKRS